MADVLSTLLDDVRPRGAVFDRSVLQGAWTVGFDGRPPLALAAMLEGDAWIAAEGDAPVALGPGDVALVVRHGPYTDAPMVRQAVASGDSSWR